MQSKWLVKNNWNLEFGTKNYISINPDLVGSFGHYLHYDVKVKNNVTDGQLFILGNRSLESSLTVEYPFILPTFSKTTYDDMPFLDLSSLKNFKTELSIAIQKINQTSKGENIFYMYMGSIWHALILLEIAAENYNPSNSFFINLFHHRAGLLDTNFPTSKYYSHYQTIFDLFKKHQNPLKVIPCSDTLLAQKTFLNYFKKETPFYPMFSVSPLEEFKKIKIKEKESNQLVVYYPGNVQEDKGFDLMVELFESVKDKRFIFRCRDHVNYDFKMMPFVNRLKANKNVEIISGKLTNEDYGRLLMEADILLIPYREKAFKGRTSGVYVDALLLEKPVVTTKQTWMGELTMEFKNGEVFEDGNINEFEEALLKVSDNYDYYKEASINSKFQWVKKNEIKNFISSLQKEQNNISSFDKKVFLKDLKSSSQKIDQGKYKSPQFIVEKLKRTKIAKSIKKNWYST